MGLGRSMFNRIIGKSGYNDAIYEDVDPLRSEFPVTPASGYWSWGAGSTIITSLLLVPTTKRFYLRNIMINNDDDVPNRVIFFDGPGVSVPIIPVQIAKSTTENMRDLKGIVVNSGIYASCVTSLTQVRVGGLIASA